MLNKPMILKICMIGNQGVGKTSIVNSFIKDNEDAVDSSIDHKQTIGVIFHTIDFNKVPSIKSTPKINIKLQIWEISGDERFKFLFKSYIKGAKGAIIVYDLTSRSSFDSVDGWLTAFRKDKRTADVPILLVGNKIDQEEQRIISKEEALNFAKSRGFFDYIECSAKNGLNMEKIFTSLSIGIIDRSSLDLEQKKSNIITIKIFGNQGVGKTSIIKYYLKDSKEIEDFDKHYRAAEGAKRYLKKDLNIPNIKFLSKSRITLQIWEIPSNEKFNFLFDKYIKDTDGSIIVYDLTSRSSFDSVDGWLTAFRKDKRNAFVPILLVGNKIDQEEQRIVSKEEAFKFAKSRRFFDYIECSAKNGLNIEEIFESLSNVVINRSSLDSLLEICDTDLILQILINLNMHNELSLNEIAKRINMSKATVSRYTRKLIDLGFIDSHEKENEPQAGTIKRKYYTLNKNFNDYSKKLENFSTESELENYWEDIYDFYRKKSFAFKTLNLISRQLIKVLQYIKATAGSKPLLFDKRDTEGVNLLLDNLEHIPFNFRFLTEKQLSQVQSITKDFNSRLEKILEDDDGSEKQYLHFNMTIPTLDINYIDKPGLYVLFLTRKMKEEKKKIRKSNKID